MFATLPGIVMLVMLVLKLNTESPMLATGITGYCRWNYNISARDRYSRWIVTLSLPDTT